jgi:ABC-type nickel/cobalt efflux system permease component RcnA
LENHGHSHNHLHVYNLKKEHVEQAEPDHGHGHKHLHAGKVKQNVLTAFSIGIVHGFAGFSHLFALLPSLALPTVTASVVYILAFTSGTIFTMVLFASILGLVAFRSAVKNRQMFLKRFTIAGAVLAITIGILWLIHPI